MAKTPIIKAIGTAVPPHRLAQAQIKQIAATIFKEKINNLDKFLPVFENASIKTRYFAKPLEWYLEEHTFAQTNETFTQTALELASKACRQAMEQAKLNPLDIEMIIFATSTGISTPTLDAKLIQKLNLSPHTKRLPIWGLGCAGGVAALTRAGELSLNFPGKFVLFVAVELCSLTFQRNDFSKANLVATSIFADGAAAAIITAEGEGLSLCGGHSTLFTGTEDIMGWDITNSGFKVRFSRDIPTLVKRHLPAIIIEACEKWNINFDQIMHYVMHPGGTKVLNAYAESLKIGQDRLENATEILRNYGNMSSVSVLFVLEKFLKTTPAAGNYGVMLALGPGFSAEQALFRW